MNAFEKLCESLEAEIQASYVSGVTLEDAEKLSGEFLHALIQTSKELKKLDLDSRMRKSGVKAVKASIYLDIVSKAEKKPTEAQIQALIDSNSLVNQEQEGLDKSEADRDDIERHFGIFKEAHVHFRKISGGKFE